MIIKANRAELIFPLEPVLRDIMTKPLYTMLSSWKIQEIEDKKKNDKILLYFFRIILKS